MRFLLFALRAANSTNQIAGYRSRDRNNNSYQLYSMILFFVSRKKIDPIKWLDIGHVTKNNSNQRHSIIFVYIESSKFSQSDCIIQVTWGEYNSILATFDDFLYNIVWGKFNQPDYRMQGTWLMFNRLSPIFEGFSLFTLREANLTN